MKDNQFFRFLIVGLINTIFYFSLYSLLLFLSNDFRLSVFIATVIGIIFSYKTFGTYVFYNLGRLIIFKFFVFYGFLYIINITFIAIIDLTLENLYISGLISSFFIAILTYYVNKHFVFNKLKKEIYD